MLKKLKVLIESNETHIYCPLVILISIIGLLFSLSGVPLVGTTLSLINWVLIGFQGYEYFWKKESTRLSRWLAGTVISMMG